MVYGNSETFHGVFYKDGTARHPEAIAAMMGCYRCRDVDLIVRARPFKPGKAYRHLVPVVEKLRKAVDSVKGVSDKQGLDQLFEEMERAANRLEACDEVPMAMPPTAKIMAWRKAETPPIDEICAFARMLADRLESCNTEKGKKESK
jgi:hypothetical protein